MLSLLLQLCQKHGDNDGKFIISETTNKLYNLRIFKPATWVPPPEAIYKIRIPPTNTKKPSKLISSLLEEYQTLKQQLLSGTREPWQPSITKTVDKHFNARVTTEMLIFYFFFGRHLRPYPTPYTHHKFYI